ncbi:MAG TPA: F0F1 ATP synthase subunit A [Candidatus Saccharimonadales bacterium]|nr:F0F1 ATP synthase subunit A [Candidatus Saccharimonadales bacterium]
MVSFIAETIFFIGRFPVTNTLLDVLLVDVLILTGLYFLNKKKSSVPNLFQNIVEYIFETFYDLVVSISPKNAVKIFPWVMTFFLFILVANLSGLVPGFGTIGYWHGKELIPFLRGAASDINFTLGLALISAVATHSLAISTIGLKDYLMRYFSLNPIYLFVGLLELVGEFTKIVSLSFRLFGNIFAGEVVLATISNMFAFILPLPFMALEMIVGLVQALVFAMLTMAFMAILMTPHGEGGEH